jgi:hypothetical protein
VPQRGARRGSAPQPRRSGLAGGRPWPSAWASAIIAGVVRAPAWVRCTKLDTFSPARAYRVSCGWLSCFLRPHRVPPGGRHAYPHRGREPTRPVRRDPPAGNARPDAGCPGARPAGRARPGQRRALRGPARRQARCLPARPRHRHAARPRHQRHPDGPPAALQRPRQGPARQPRPHGRGLPDGRPAPHWSRSGGHGDPRRLPRDARNPLDAQRPAGGGRQAPRPAPGRLGPARPLHGARPALPGVGRPLGRHGGAPRRAGRGARR